jgi:hypothetical protein
MIYSGIAVNALGTVGGGVDAIAKSAMMISVINAMKFSGS